MFAATGYEGTRFGPRLHHGRHWFTGRVGSLLKVQLPPSTMPRAPRFEPKTSQLVRHEEEPSTLPIGSWDALALRVAVSFGVLFMSALRPVELSTCWTRWPQTIDVVWMNGKPGDHYATKLPTMAFKRESVDNIAGLVFKLLTMQISKGLKFRVVAVSGAGHMPEDGQDKAEEARLSYVAATPATQRLPIPPSGSGKFAARLSE